MENQGQIVTTLKLNGENWVPWKFQTAVILKGKGLYDIVTGEKVKPETESEKWVKDDARAQEIIVTRIEQGPLTHLLTCETSKEMWTKLRSVYDKESVVSIHLMQQKFFMLNCSPDDTISTFISKLEDIRNKLKQAGENLSEKMMITKILMSLPERYRHFCSAWESVPTEKQSLDELTSRLLIEEERWKTTEPTTALASLQIKCREPTRKGGATKQFQGVCYVCHKPGHIARNCTKRKERDQEIKKCTYCKKVGHLQSECWHRKNRERQDKKQEEKVETNAFIGTPKMLNDYDWCMDTGATEHMCRNKDMFEDMKMTEVNRKVKLGDGNLLEVKGIGTVRVYADNGDEIIPTVLSNVLYVPNLKVNLFSVGCVLDKGFTMVSNSDRCELKDKNGKVRAIAERSSKLYKMKFSRVSYGCVAESSNEKKQDIVTWHNRLAHQDINHIRDVLRRSNIKYKDNEAEFVCERCLEGKQHKFPYQGSDSRASKVLEIVHADVCGPMETESLGGARYFLLLKDDYSSYRHVYFMKNKSEVRKNIEKFILKAENETDNKLKVLRTDNGLEFTNREVQEMLDKRGIKHQRSVVYTPQQNGRAERDMRTLVEAARSMLNGMNKKFWAEAVNNAVYTINRTGKSHVSNKSPYEVWYQKDVSLNQFKVFGSRVSVHVPKEQRLKWDSKNKIGILMGYSDTTKGYRIYFEDSNKVEIYRDVVFLPEKTDQKQIEVTEQVNSSFQSENEEDTEEPESEKEQEERHDRYNLRQNRQRPSRLDDYDVQWEASFLSVYEEDEPTTYEMAVTSNEKDKWKEAIQEEIKALEDNETWTCNEKPYENRVVECKWVFKRKRNESGSVVKHKARLVAKGFQQTGMLFNDFYSPVAKLPSIRIFLAICNYLKIEVCQLDICSAFLNGTISEDVYISLPKGFKQKEGTICKLRKSLYGLKSSPKSWYNKFHNLMLSLKFKRSENEYCFYVKISETDKLYILIYVDDVLLAGTDKSKVEKVKNALKENFKLKDLGLVSHFLGMIIKQDIIKGETIISQTKYVENILQKYNMLECKSVTTPMDVNFKHDILKRDFSESPEIENRCRILIGLLMYLMLCTRPDLCITVSILSRYQSCASIDLWQSLKRILRYLKGTKNLCLNFKVPNEDINMLTGYVDSDWAGDRVDRKSTSGYVFKLLNCSVSWCSRKQCTVALSTTEAEYIALSLGVSEACWIRYFVHDFKLDNDFICVKIFADNQSAIKVSKNPEFHKRLKHVDIKFHFVRDKINNGVVTVNYLSTDNQIADMFTKPLSLYMFNKFRNQLGLEIYH